MEKFARLLNSSHGQVLMLIDWENDEGGYQLSTIVQANGVRATTRVTFSSKDDAIARMENFDENKVDEFAGKLYRMLDAPSEVKQIVESTLL